MPKPRQYEALRAYLVEGRLAKDVAHAFGYTLNSFHVLCHHFRRETHPRSEEHTSELQSHLNLVCRLLLEKKKNNNTKNNLKNEKDITKLRSINNTNNTQQT